MLSLLTVGLEGSATSGWLLCSWFNA